ncbi:MAG: glycosyltransferase [Thiotrichaceae bacterium]|nr:glycosyltransferase [Thiotrichaceae bacterium]
MQIMVLGMHRSGTSAVARLLNMMGMYFAPERMELPATKANPKGYWERRDVVNLNEEIFAAMGISWDKISDYDSSQITPEISTQFSSRAQEIVLGLDAHRPWMMKDPRLNLLLPLWLPLLELPVCVYVYRSPIQVAQSLAARENFSIHLGLALWEKYNLIALADSAHLPRILISYEELMSNPLGTVKYLYDSLQNLEIQGLRLPHDKEVTAFVDANLFHAKGDDSLQGEYINSQQLALFEAFKNGSALTQTLPKLSQGAVSVLAEYETRLANAHAFEQQQQALHAQLAEREQQQQQLRAEFEQQRQSLTSELEQAAHDAQQKALELQSLTAENQHKTRELKALEEVHESTVSSFETRHKALQESANAARKSVVDYHYVVLDRDQAISKKEQQLSRQAQQLSALHETHILQNEDLRKLNYWVAAYQEDITSIFNSLTWKAGNFVTRLALMLTFRRAGSTAKDHLERLMSEATAWRNKRHGSAEYALPSETGEVHHAASESERPADPRDYARWIKNYDTLTAKGVNKIRARIKQWNSPPLISVVLPTYNTPEKYLRAVLDSICQQYYPHWELCIADDASTKPHVHKVLDEYARRDKRIKIIYRSENGHISAATNSALSLVTGEFVAFVDHDDLLPLHALFWVAQDLIDHPDGMLWYSDEDKISADGERYAPYFKSDWNYDLFLSHNVVTHLAVYRTSLIEEVGGLREGVEGAQDYDLVLRVIEHVQPSQIHHIPHILYHWRAIEGSTATCADEKPYALLAAQKAIAEHLERIGAKAKVLDAPELPGMSRVQYTLPENPPLVSLIIPTYNGLKILRCCVSSILQKTRYPNYEILIINNNSDDPATISYMQELEARGQARIIDYPHPFNYADMNNLAVEQANGELVGLLNNDIEVINNDWLDEMVGHALRPEVGVVGARLWYPNETLQHGGVVLGIGGVAGHGHKGSARGDVGYFGRAALIQNFSAVTGACLLARKEVYQEVKGLDAENLKISLNDVDFCLKLVAAGYRVVWTPYADLYHHESISRGYEDTPEKAARFEKERQYMLRRWSKFLTADPAYSPNLTLDTQDFVYAWPPRVELLG